MTHPYFNLITTALANLDSGNALKSDCPPYSPVTEVAAQHGATVHTVSIDRDAEDGDTIVEE